MSDPEKPAYFQEVAEAMYGEAAFAPTHKEFRALRDQVTALRKDIATMARVLAHKLTLAEKMHPDNESFSNGIPYRRDVPWEDVVALRRIASSEGPT